MISREFIAISRECAAYRQVRSTEATFNGYTNKQNKMEYIMGLFGDIFDIATAPVRIAVSIVEASAEVASVVTKPIAEVANEVAKGANEVVKDIKNGL